MPRIPFAEWRPDMPDLGQWAREALNVVPGEESYTPFQSLAAATDALTARAQGAAWFRCPDGTQKMFAGDAARLYLLSGAAWSDVSRLAGGAYATGGDNAWRFEQFGPLAIAVNGVDAPQKFDLAAGTRWQPLGGSPPVGAFVANVGDFLVMAKIGTARQRVQWSAIDDCESWGSDPTTQADVNDEPDGGDITGLVGGEFGLIFQEAAIRRMTYEGSPVVFRIDKIARDLGASIPSSVAGVADLAFFLHKSGFHMIQGGQTITPIGRGKVDRTFWREFDETNAFRASAAIDPVRGLYIFAYPANGNAGTPNRLLIYNWRTARWSRATQTCELVYSGVAQKSYTLEELDAFGTLETLPFSLDSSYWTGITSLLLFGFDTGHRAGAFNGTVMPATVETAELAPGGGRRVTLRGCRPLIDGGAPAIAAGVRESQQAIVTYTPFVGLTGAGLAPLRRSGRYFRLRATLAAGAAWSNMQGIDDLDVQPAGRR
ncbi:hypothetical protein [Enhydrobacter sp.]|jgi:hypothetical protein|uniref:hypothetical protein n=1 Tax=Enhydrobacter sp. TaxID=1894999 RepID=UPI0026189256|nr:hypothetical protein [Enhydrobacter sp.]WIM14492.1 MAG: hypothetical protein OJF58_005462 [Enhydrobacter sp.]